MKDMPIRLRFQLSNKLNVIFYVFKNVYAQQDVKNLIDTSDVFPKKLEIVRCFRPANIISVTR